MKSFVNKLFRFSQRPQPRMGLGDFALLLGQERPLIAFSGPAAGNQVRRDLRTMDSYATVPTNAVPLSYVLGDAPMAVGSMSLTGLVPLPRTTSEM